MNDIIKYGLKFIGIILLQVLILKNIDLNFGVYQYFHFIVYPIFIFNLPVRTPKSLLILIGFFTGFTIDLFYDSPGVHAAALTLTAFLRSSVLKWVEPVEGFSTSAVPDSQSLGYSAYFIYAAVLLFIHLIAYFSIEAFSFLYFFDIALRAIWSFIISILLLVLLQFIFRI